MLIIDLIKYVEATAESLLPGPSNAEYDEKFYDTARLTAVERRQAYDPALQAPEGSVMIVAPGPDSGGIHICACPDPLARGQARAKAVVAALNDHLRSHPEMRIDTVVIPGCGSSPVGAAAFGKTVADTLGKPVAAIVAGQGKMDAKYEILSGGLLMAPFAKAFLAYDAMLELAVRMNPMAAYWAATYSRELTDSIHEASTLLELLKDRLIRSSGEGIKLRGPKRPALDMIVSHSKGNWAVLAALLDFELNIVDRLQPPVALKPRIDVVTFGNWVNLPDKNPLLAKLFHYHQFVGTHDKLALLNSPPTAMARLYCGMKIDTLQPVDHGRDPDEMLFFGRDHNLIAGKADHMPIETLLPAIRAH